MKKNKLACFTNNSGSYRISSAIWFMISEKKYYEVDVPSLWWSMHVYNKIISKQGIQKNMYQNFEFFQA